MKINVVSGFYAMFFIREKFVRPVKNLQDQ